MTNRDQHDITKLLTAWKGGDMDALDRLTALVYPELRRIARRNLKPPRAGNSLDSAALTNEAYLKLAHAGGIGCENRAHFIALCSQVMRRILVDHARRRGYAKRGGNAVQVPLDEVLLVAQEHGVEVLALNDALEALARIDNRKSRVIELRYFGGLSIDETAEVLEVSADTVKRDFRMARAWLLAAISGAGPT
jgi:RNA polymerase sigma-70 factor (ECF subfamily)